MSVPSRRLETSSAPAGRLDKALAAAFPDVSRARFQALIADGAVSVEGSPVTEARHRVKPGDMLSVLLPAAAPALPQAEDMALPIVFEDKDLIVIDKPSGLVVHPGAGNETGTLVNALIAHCGDSLSGIGGVRRPGIVHRLDKDTSGLLVVAKNDRAHHGLSEQFAAHGRDGRLERSYLAIVWGVPERRKGSIEAAIDRSTANRRKMAVSKGANAREAVTHYEVLEVLGQPPVASLVRCVLETGRTHQIRVHMAHIGHPLLGDSVYGSGFRTSARKLPDDAGEALNALNRQALHATTLGFEHPRTGQQLRFDSPAPEDFDNLLQALRLNNT
ncbi:MAG: RluA family pseudouridine synthase [Aestuariivirga sp.]|uniref:RluA family pseudouridine synthase n=1 Tax=Aestuariivirga sp. TaxID=2650926 RepID=UPI0025BC56AB|nr:RluA family pseudouridine synthase [Aestuariivirga sp.]MCA3560874.1 RluA family pseudouridine synthase [Aestuariivirga sp.]